MTDDQLIAEALAEAKNLEKIQEAAEFVGMELAFIGPAKLALLAVCGRLATKTPWRPMTETPSEPMWVFFTHQYFGEIKVSPYFYTDTQHWPPNAINWQPMVFPSV